ncbi:MAG: hypothetical protein K1X89_19580 [Myxococcaceae bacterium]|nr:hypothetical protein [Myxococcaceae bacterium]
MKFGWSMVLLLVACGPKVLPPEGPHLLWETDPQSLNNPFPDARFLSGGGAPYRTDWFKPFLMKTSATPSMSHFLNAYATVAQTQVHGIGNLAPVLILPSEKLDPASLPGAAVRLMNRNGTWSVLEANVVIEHSLAALDGTDHVAPDDYPDFFLVRPGLPLPEDATGMLVIKKGPKTKAGAALERGRAFDGAKPDLAPLAAAMGVDASEILLALPQTPAKVTEVWKSLIAWTQSAAGVPTITIPSHGKAEAFGGGSRPVGMWTDADADWSVMTRWLQFRDYGRPATPVSRVVIGSFGLHDLRGTDGAWRDDWVLDPSKSPVQQIPFVLSIPAGPKPAGGWRTIVAVHGTGGRNVPKDTSDESFCLEQAVLLAQRGLACLGIDAPSHGERGTVDKFFPVENLPALRENIREMPFDLFQVVRAIPLLDVDGDHQPDLAGEYGFFGNSLGSIISTGFVTQDPHLTYAAFNMCGGGLSNILMSTYIHELIGLLLVRQTDLVPFSTEYSQAFFAFRAAAQPILEPADPINFAGQLRGDMALLHQEGLRDQLIPNHATEDLARAFGMTPATGNVTGTTPLHAFAVHDPAKYLSAEKAKDYNGHNVYDFAPVREEIMRFLETRGHELVLAP